MIAETADDGFTALMDKVQRERGFVSASYKENCLRRRVGVRMRIRGVATFSDYTALIDRDGTELDRLVDALTINVTRFFRNWPIWERIAEEVVRPLWHAELPEIRAWSAGCASGEEAYSLAMLFHRQAATQGMLAQIERVHVLGTDLDRRVLGMAEAGEYRETDLAEMPAEFRSRYIAGPPFRPVEGIRKLVRFARHDLLGGDYPPAEQHLIVCRNVLIYFDRPTQERVIEQFHDALAPGGFLVLGKVETLLGGVRRRFVATSQRDRIFRKVS